MNNKKMLFNIIWRSTALAIIISLLLFTTSFLIIGGIYYQKVRNYLHNNFLDDQTLIGEIKSGLQTAPVQSNDRKTFLLLGVDTIENRVGDPPLTDTMMLVSLNLKSAKINLLPLPRDLYSSDYKTKINALFFYGLEKSPNEPTALVTKAISELIDLPIEHTVVITLDQVSTLIDLIGGIDVQIEQSFVDDRFPRSDVDVKVVHDPMLLYETVSFNAGIEHMSGERALKYIRSRHSLSAEGTDDARSTRQTQIINALVIKLTSTELYKNDQLIVGKLLNFYQQHFSSAFTIKEGVSTLKTLLPIITSPSINMEMFNKFSKDWLILRDVRLKMPVFKAHQLPIKTRYSAGVIYNPPLSRKYQMQWLYEIPDVKLFREVVKSYLYEN